jgi:hypothetical protein
MERRQHDIDPALRRADAVFYGIVSSTAVMVALTNLYVVLRKWMDPNATDITLKTIDHIRPLAALHQAGQRHLYEWAVWFVMNVPVPFMSAAIGALVFLLVKRPRSVFYSVFVTLPLLATTIVAAFDVSRLTLLWISQMAISSVGAIAVFHCLSNLASRVAPLESGQAVEPEARLLRVLGMLLAIAPAVYLGLEVHRFFYVGFDPRMVVLVPFALGILSLPLGMRYGSRPALFAYLAAALVLWFLIANLLVQYACGRPGNHSSCDWVNGLVAIPLPLLGLWILHRVFLRILRVWRAHADSH